MTFEFLKDKYPKNGLVIVHSITELQAIFSEIFRSEEPINKITVGIPAECIELSEAGQPQHTRLGIVEFYSGLAGVKIIVLKDFVDYKREYERR